MLVATQDQSGSQPGPSAASVDLGGFDQPGFLTGAGVQQQQVPPNPIDAVFQGSRWRREDVALVVSVVQLGLILGVLYRQVSD